MTAASHDVLVALGSNLGDREANLRFALDALQPVVATSQVYETAPVGGPGGQGAYLNMVARVGTDLSAQQFLDHCNDIEARAGRVRVERWGPRTLDVDILYFDDLVIELPELVIPHPRIQDRRFVLAPLEEIAPERCDPGWRDRLPDEMVEPRGPLR